jgi:hypothetical protein
MLVKRADSHKSGARFVGHGLEDSTLGRRENSCHNKRLFSFQARKTRNIKNESHHEKQRAMNDNQRPKRLAQNKNHKTKNFAYLASKPRLQNRHHLQTNYFLFSQVEGSLLFLR